jgi:hypothetical protein
VHLSQLSEVMIEQPSDGKAAGQQDRNPNDRHDSHVHFLAIDEEMRHQILTPAETILLILLQAVSLFFSAV